MFGFIYWMQGVTEFHKYFGIFRKNGINGINGIKGIEGIKGIKGVEGVEGIEGIMEE